MRALFAAAAIAVISLAGVGTTRQSAPNPGPTVPLADELPAAATAKLAESLTAAREQMPHVWRDTPGVNGDGSVNVYIEIARGDVRKWELDMRSNTLKVDRVMPPEVGGYPINYGFVPQSVSYDGDPFDALVTGPAIPGGTLVKGIIIGLLQMTDEKGPDSKVVLSPIGSDGRPRFPLADADRQRVAEFFRGYKRHDPQAFSTVSGWGNAADGRAHLELTHAFFRQCGERPGEPCRVALK